MGNANVNINGWVIDPNIAQEKNPAVYQIELVAYVDQNKEFNNAELRQPRRMWS